eukprot:Gb_06524 [translate_table: standard]
MEFSFAHSSVLIILWTLLTFHQAFVANANNVHIIYMGQKQYQNPQLNEQLHREILASVLGSKEAANDSIVYSYKHSFSGFAAKLTHSQAKFIADLPGVACVVPNKIINIHTTRTWEFLQLSLASPKGLLHDSKMGEDIIVGMIDTGIWPESESFNDSYMTPIPLRWKGTCQEGEAFNSSNCNRKIIGARWYIRAYEAEFGPLNKSEVTEFVSARDALGHGTHTSSTAAGNLVDNASFLRLAAGSARGGAPHARISMYKVCWATGDCSSADILAAFDDAILDGVDVISVSLGSPPPLSAYFEDPIAIGSFHAMEKGITVVSSAGNSGPFSETVINTAPWLITVAASTIDRTFPTAITLGNNQTFKGQALYTEKQREEFYSLVYAEDIVTADTTVSRARGQGLSQELFTCRSCEAGSLNATLAKGKFVLCFQTRTQRPSNVAALNVYNAQGVGVIFAQIPTKTIVSSPIIPCVQVDFEVGTNILSYIRTTRFPVVRLAVTETILGKTLAPEIAYFSSRGPSSLSPSVLKHNVLWQILPYFSFEGQLFCSPIRTSKICYCQPDIAAPGVNILAAWAPITPPSDMPSDKRSINFNIASGTSMACPHVSGIVSLLKALHPRWSPAAIKSALVTTVEYDTYCQECKLDAASVMDEYTMKMIAEAAPHKLADPFDYGGGHVNPNKAADPGLVYDMETTDYIPFLCSMGYNESAISLVTGKSNVCPTNSTPVSDLNLPSISIPNLTHKLTIQRTVTNVGPEWSLYKIHIESPSGVHVKVKPRLLTFNPTIKKLSFKVIFKTTLNLEGRYSFGSLVWTNGEHVVRIPIAVRTVTQDSLQDFL